MSPALYPNYSVLSWLYPILLLVIITLPSSTLCNFFGYIFLCVHHVLGTRDSFNGHIYTSPSCCVSFHYAFRERISPINSSKSFARQFIEWLWSHMLIDISIYTRRVKTRVGAKRLLILMLDDNFNVILVDFSLPQDGIRSCCFDVFIMKEGSNRMTKFQEDCAKSLVSLLWIWVRILVSDFTSSGSIETSRGVALNGWLIGVKLERSLWIWWRQNDLWSCTRYRVEDEAVICFVAYSFSTQSDSLIGGSRLTDSIFGEVISNPSVRGRVWEI